MNAREAGQPAEGLDPQRIQSETSGSRRRSPESGERMAGTTMWGLQDNATAGLAIHGGAPVHGAREESCMKERGREIRGRGEQGKKEAEKKGGAHLLALASCWSPATVAVRDEGAAAACSGTRGKPHGHRQEGGGCTGIGQEGSGGGASIHGKQGRWSGRIWIEEKWLAGGFLDQERSQGREWRQAMGQGG